MVLASPMLTIYLTPTFKAISFSYLPGVITAVLFGPWAALIYGLAADTVGYMANPTGGYFFGYAISAMVTYFIYAVLLYGSQNDKLWQLVVRAAIARILIIGIVFFGLNFQWARMTYGQVAGAFFTGVRLINNAVQFPFHVALTVGAIKLLNRVPNLALRSKAQ
jgi:ECF transporter S component (folate family)